MKALAFTAVKFETTDLAACENFFAEVFGFQVVHRYGCEASDPFEEIVMTLRGEDAMMLKFLQSRNQPTSAMGATIQVKVDDIEAAIAVAEAAGASVTMEPADYPEASVSMAVITTGGGLHIELVREI